MTKIWRERKQMLKSKSAKNPAARLRAQDCSAGDCGLMAIMISKLHLGQSPIDSIYQFI